jgi:hypothetical protein
MLNGEPAIKAGARVKDSVIAGAQSQPEETEAPIAPRDRPYDNKLSQIADTLESLANKQVTLKAPVEERWLRAIRIYHGKYDAQFLAALKEAGQSTAFLKIARSKTVALEARLFDLMFPTDDRNWDVQATPVPKLSDEVKQAETRAENAAMQANAAEQAGQDSSQIVAAGDDEAARADAAKNEIAKAEAATKSMREEMDDQLIECKWPAQTRDSIHDFCLLGPAIQKGPMVNEKTRGSWMPLNRPGNEGVQAQDHEYELKQTEDVRPMLRRVNPWNFFPDMSASCIDECEFFFERYLWTKTQLRRMVKTHGFDPDAVRELLRDNRDKERRATSRSNLNNLVTLRSLTDDSTGQITGRFVGWEYHGPLECEDVCTILTAMGREQEAIDYEKSYDPLTEQRVIVHFCEGVVLKIAPLWPLDSGEPLYSMANCEEAEGQLFGYGIPTILEDAGDSLNSAWRMALDNGALSVGPQALIAKDEVAPADGNWTFRPKKIWWRIKGALAHAPQSIQFFDVPNNMEEIALIINLAIQFIDLESGIPQPQAGEEAKSTPTVGGMAILQSNTNIIFRRIVKNLDDGLIAPSIRRLYDWNMQFSKKAEIKGDMQVDARGTSVLLVKEVQAQNLMLIVTQLMANPAVSAMIKAYPTIQKLFQSMMIKPSEVMITEDDYKKYLENQAKQPPPKQPQEIAAEARIQAAQIAADISKQKSETDKLIEQLRQHTAMIELAAHGDISMEELRTELAGKHLDNQHKERMLVAEAAIDKENAADAREHGEEPGGSGGSVNAGAEAPKRKAA